MRLYRVHLDSEQEGSQGFAWASSRREANRKAVDFERSLRDGTTTIEEVTITTDKAGVLRALNRYASHPDNG